MVWTKAKIAIVVSASVLLAATTAVVINNHTHQGRAFTNEPMSVVARWLEDWSGKPVVDATGLEDHYDVIIEWPEKQRLDWQTRRESIRHALENQCNLTLVPRQNLTKMLVIQRVKN
jgi:uncharacterized protein (TIGR03435 family)